jgi:raffinose/stachyose/melibiose transport system substrate-binding protein
MGAGDARSARSGNVTISMLITTTGQSGWQVLIPNFERVYPNITVTATYATSGTGINQLETTELAGGNAPDLLAVSPGCGQPLSICKLAKAGYLAPLINEPWAKRSLPLATSLDKYGQGLFAFTPAVDPEGIFTNDALFKKLGLSIPQTFPQLLTVCQKAKADGTAALVFAGGTPFTTFMAELSVGTVYAKDKTWLAELRAGKTTFEATAGWHQALQEVIDMSNAGCFQPGALGTSSSDALADFAQGQGLMTMQLCSFKGEIDLDGPQFPFSFHLFPGGTSPTQIRTLVNLSASLGINAHSSAANQAAAKAFIDFIARPKQNALYAQTIGGLTQYQFLKQQVSGFMGSDIATMIEDRAWVVNPLETFWNASVLTVLQQDGAGLLTGQVSIDDFLNAMDAAWKQGPG